MVRRVAVTVVLFVGTVACLLVAARADSAEPPGGGTAFRSVASVHGLMAGQGLLFKELQRLINGPKAPDRAKNVEHTSEALAELANVNVLHGEKDDYRTWAGQLRDTAMLLAAEGKKKAAADEGQMKTLLGKLEATCTACHDAYQ